MKDFFEPTNISTNQYQPLADKIRPEKLEDVVGQAHLLGPSSPIKRMIDSEKILSSIFWGPPGTGKTSIARVIANLTNYNFVEVSAVFSGVSDLRKIFESAKVNRKTGKETLLFVDEIHRFNKSQQDSFLPYIENGTVILIGATTENPSFELNPPLLSRAKVLAFKRLSQNELSKLLERCEKIISIKLPLNDESRDQLCAMADGDGRYLINMVEEIISLPKDKLLSSDQLTKLFQSRSGVYDKDRDYHFNLISALHKSIRGSDPDASLYWLARMLSCGENPLYISRRLVRIASEDIGVSDPNALVQALSADKAYRLIGSPEGELALAQAVVYLAVAPKSNSTYKAFDLALASSKNTGSLPPPNHALNAPTQLMKEHEFSKGYLYDHDSEDGFSGQSFFPDGMNRDKYYLPSKRGLEFEISQRLDKWEKIRNSKLDKG